MSTLASCGTWVSPLTASAVAAGAVRLGGVVLDGAALYWIEGRPADGGRHVVVTQDPDGRLRDVTPPGTNVRTRVHEYGGAAYTVVHGTVYYSEFADGRLYRIAPGGIPVPLTPPAARCYADFTVHPERPWLVCVCEDHAGANTQAVTTLVRVTTDGPPSAAETIASGADFYAYPRFSPDGSRLSWMSWDHPRMPWDATELWVAQVDPHGCLEDQRQVRGDGTEAIFQPGWAPDGTLCFASDRSGWWNLYRLRDGGDGGVEPVSPMEADCGRPLWQLGMATWTYADPARLVVTYQDRGRWRLATIDPADGTRTDQCAGLEPGDTLAGTCGSVAFVAGSPTTADAVVRLDLTTRALDTVQRASPVALDAGYVSTPEPIEFRTGGGLTAHAFYYPPRNRDFTTPPGERPPLVVVSHGGPTASTSTRLNLELQFWTSRGFAVVDVNYGGSSGYGRAYRERLRGQWGIVDVEDCVQAATYLAATGRVDPDRMVIRGRSAGGFTTLKALTTYPTVFAAGASYYGVSDLEAMTRETHKFESRYLDALIGPYPADRRVYRARSPIHAIDRVACPLILFQGLEDAVVPPNQSQMIAEALRARGLRVVLLTFEGEQHGFRRAESIVRCLEAELSFYGDVLGFPTAGAPASVDVANRHPASQSPEPGQS